MQCMLIFIVKLIGAIKEYRKQNLRTFRWCTNPSRKDVEGIIKKVYNFFMAIVFETGPDGKSLAERRIWHENLIQFLAM